jgi:phosphatidylinositol kinase/protein kinase (PI-3  family)
MPFNMIIVGMTACGKTHYLISELKTTFRHTFENIFLICPTYHWNRTYDQDFIYDDENFFVIPCRQDDVESYLRSVVDFTEGRPSLIILDDCASTKSVKDRTGELVRLGFGARHMSISTIVITQQLTSIAKPYRQNVSKLITFYNPNRQDMRVILDEYLLVDSEEMRYIREQLKNSKYAHLEVSLMHPYGHELKVPLIK